MADAVLKQTNRSIVLDSPLGPDALIATYFDGRRAICRNSSASASSCCRSKHSAEDILGKGITVELQTLEGTEEKKRRVFHGIVVRFAPGPCGATLSQLSRRTGAMDLVSHAHDGLPHLREQEGA
jgi:uncharacterized protein involved in type VI secretion and phage assembly